MREVKFRGLRKDYTEGVNPSKWVIGNLLNPTNIGEVGANLDSYCYAEVIEESVGQFTGLKDKNGVDIYEGDVVNAYHSHWERTDEGIVFFDAGTFMLYSVSVNGDKRALRYWSDGQHDWHSLEQYDTWEIEVIGNIHEK